MSMGKLAVLKLVKDIIVKAVAKTPELDGCLKVVNLGEVVTDNDIPILFEADALAENMPVFTIDPASGEEVPLVSGSYTLKTGEVIEVLDGVCTKITPVDAPPADGSTEAKTTTPAATPATPKSTVERHEIESHFKTAFVPLISEIEKLKAENKTLAETNTKLTEDKKTLEAEVVKLGEKPAGTPAKGVLELSTQQTKLSADEILKRNRQKLQEIKNKN